MSELTGRAHVRLGARSQWFSADTCAMYCRRNIIPFQLLGLPPLTRYGARSIPLAATGGLVEVHAPRTACRILTTSRR
jgi:hypothetical protein